MLRIARKEDANFSHIQGGPKKWYLSYITLLCTRGITFLAHPV